MITLATAKKYAEKLNVDLSVIGLHNFRDGMKVELEHRNVTKGNLLTTAKIVCAHLEEFPDYYQRLSRLEASAEKFWKNKTKPSIYL